MSFLTYLSLSLFTPLTLLLQQEARDRPAAAFGGRGLGNIRKPRVARKHVSGACRAAARGRALAGEGFKFDVLITTGSDGLNALVAARDDRVRVNRQSVFGGFNGNVGGNGREIHARKVKLLKFREG